MSNIQTKTVYARVDAALLEVQELVIQGYRVQQRSARIVGNHIRVDLSNAVETKVVSKVADEAVASEVSSKVATTVEDVSQETTPKKPTKATVKKTAPKE